MVDGAGLGTGPFEVSANVSQVINTLVNLNFTNAAPATTSGPLSGVIANAGGTATIRLNGTNYTVNQTAAELVKLQGAARLRAAHDPSFEQCTSRVSRRAFECAMAAENVDRLEQCML